MKTTTFEQAMKTAKTIEELNGILKKAMIAFHPDNNLDNLEEATTAFLFIREMYANEMKRFVGYKTAKQIEKEVAKRNGILKIRRNIQSADEFFSMDGTEQMSVLKGMGAHVAIVLDGMTPTPNARQITDKHHADAYGNFDGMRSYAFVQYVFNKNHTINEERLEEVGQTAWIKLAENATKEKYNGIPFYSLLWISCRQAIYNLYHNEVKHDSYMDRQHDLFDLNAYESKAPTDSHTESNALYNVWVGSFFADDTDNTIYEASKAGYTEIEIAAMVGLCRQAVNKRMRTIHDKMNKDRLLEGLNVSETGLGIRKNASAKETVRILIMLGIRNGISYKRIAYYLHCDEKDIPAMLRK